MTARLLRHGQAQLTGKASLSEMTDGELKLVVNHLKEKGFRVQAAPRQRHAAAPRADLRFAHVMWRLLGEAGVLERPGRDGLNAFVRARFEAAWGSVPVDIDMLRDHGQIQDVVEALKAWCLRADIELEP
ncbi:regulatory protein GemA [Fluviibacterium sp. DFM31]|uniref:Regulatory protein GemA n=1 Tax=Meridianimarinicoccus marinus TaxID=3231483 RepID=A0ABV3L8D7_9RHOB